MFPIILPARKMYISQDRCIYCGTEEPNRTIEHIVPFALDGRLTIPSASCAACQKQTWWAETKLLESLLLGPRRFLGIRRRKKKNRPDIPQMGVIDRQPADELPENMEEANFRWSNLPENERPVQIVLPQLPAPNLLGGPPSVPNGLQLNGFSLVVLRPAKAPDESDKSHVALNMFEPSCFARSLAKIAHAAAVAELGASGFNPILPDYIRNLRSDYGRVLGSSRFGRFKRDRPVYLSLHREERWIVARIQIFAQYATPTFSVVVGESDGLYASNRKTLIMEVRG